MNDATPEKSGSDDESLPSIIGKIVNQRELSEIFGCAQKTLWKWQKEEGMPVAHVSENGLANQYNTADVIAWYAARAARKSEESPKDRLDRINGDLKELELAEKLGKLVSVDEIEPAWTSEILSTRQALLSLPARAAPLLVHMQSVDAMRDFLTEQVEEALTKLSNGTNGSTDDDAGAGTLALGAATANPAVSVG